LEQLRAHHLTSIENEFSNVCSQVPPSPKVECNKNTNTLGARGTSKQFERNDPYCLSVQGDHRNNSTSQSRQDYNSICTNAPKVGYFDRFPTATVEKVETRVNESLPAIGDLTFGPSQLSMFLNGQNAYDHQPTFQPQCSSEQLANSSVPTPQILNVNRSDQSSVASQNEDQMLYLTAQLLPQPQQHLQEPKISLVVTEANSNGSAPCHPFGAPQPAFSVNIAPQREPVTSAILPAPTPQQCKRVLGEHLFSKLQPLYSRRAGKITGILLEMEDSELWRLLGDDSMLVSKANEALKVCRDEQIKQKLRSQNTARLQSQFRERA